MTKSIIDVLDTKTNSERQAFYTAFANNLTLSIREVMADDSLDAAEKNRIVQRLNEASHRILNQVLSLYKETSTWEDKEIFLMLKSLSGNDSAILNSISAAIKLTSLSKEMEDK